MTGEPKERVHIHRRPHVCCRADRHSLLDSSFLFAVFRFCLHHDSLCLSCGRDIRRLKLVNKGFKAFILHHRKWLAVLHNHIYQGLIQFSLSSLNQQMWISVHTHTLFQGIIVVLYISNSGLGVVCGFVEHKCLSIGEVLLLLKVSSWAKVTHLTFWVWWGQSAPTHTIFRWKLSHFDTF